MGNSGVVLLGGAHGALALARSLGMANVPVSYITHDSPLPGWSKFVRKKIRWSGPHDPQAVAFLLEAAERYGLEGDLLVPAADAEVCLVSQNIPALSAAYRIMLPPWESLKWVCDKPFLYKRAVELGLNIPKTYHAASFEHVSELALSFPVVLKPHMGGGESRISKAKVVRADDETSFLAAYDDAVAEIGAENLVVQELVPGGGESQFSYAALWNRGQPVAEFTARRTRQYPVDFGHTSTFVEVVDEPRAIETARRLLSSVNHSGLVEVEFKHDHRDDSLKLLDVNPRPWSWFGLCAAAGVDLGMMLWEVANDRAATPAVARPRTAWMYLVRDIFAVAKLAARGQVDLAQYLRSSATVRAWATFALNDPLPGLADLPLTAWRVLTRRVFVF